MKCVFNLWWLILLLFGCGRKVCLYWASSGVISMIEFWMWLVFWWNFGVLKKLRFIVLA